MQLSKYPIGFWNYMPIGAYGPECVKDWVDLGMTFATSPVFTRGADKQKMLDILDECERKGVRVILFDDRVYFHNLSRGEEVYRRDVQAAIDDFGDHPAVLGFHIGDEPSNEEMFAFAQKAYAIHRELAPRLTPHLNFLPYYEDLLKKVLRTDSFEEWVTEYVNKTGIDLLCYDCYTQMLPEEHGTDLYFENLRHYVAGAKRSGAEPWTTLLSVAHYNYQKPTEDNLRWQLNTAVCSGMKGILWFFVYEGAPKCNYRVPPIDEFYERTETFEWLSRVNRHFLHEFGDFFKAAEHVATYHTVKAYGGYPLFEANKSDDILMDVTAPVPAVVSFFRKDGKKYVAVVNNSKTENGLFHLHLRPDVKEFRRLSWDGVWRAVKDDHWDAVYFETPDEIVGGDWLAPGQMKVYQLS